MSKPSAREGGAVSPPPADSDSQLEQIMAVTAADRQRAAALLAAAGGSVQRAINIHFEAERVPEPASNGADAERCSPAPAAAASEVEGAVRAPIPPRAEVMLDPAHSAANYALPSRRSRLRQTDSVFDKFRDFSAEIRLQESQLAGPGPSQRAAPPGADHPERYKLQTLEEIFRPPLELIFRGTFQAARDQGIADNKWLMVNVQNTEEFACQVLNRDVWSSHKVRDIVRANFIFWQVYHESSEGLKYKTFYPVSSWPYVAILDPRTGELLRTWSKLDKNSAIELLIDFLEAHKFSEDAPPTPKRPRVDSVLELDEEAQLRLAIEKSLQHDQPSGRRRPVVPDSDSDEDDADFWAESAELSTVTSAPLSPSRRSERVSPAPPAHRPAESGDRPPGPAGDGGPADQERSGTAETAPERTAAEAITGTENGANGSGSAADHRTTQCDNTEAKSQTENGVGDGKPACGAGSRGPQCAPVSDGAAAEEWRRHLGSATDPSWTLALRLPDGSRLQLELPCSSRLRCVTEYVQQLGYPAREHVLLATFPRRELSAPERADQTLREAGLHPHDTVFVQSR
ncbi:UBX domain-containing protein 7 [Amphibalanus amphitrite]|uniref:UBX domain-containing protein 7 n=1 Tax=Amphibalanus amphitrite TaxID=1232801 RepID=A0A6A4WV78_AMPAM|nr:UBX domain-containing protein 7 [Amphibalanus amphitrite]